MNAKGELEAGDVFKTATGDVWLVNTTSASGAYCIHLSAHPSPITTRKKVTKMVNRHLPNTVFSLASVVDLVDKTRLNMVAVNRRVEMARKQAEVQESDSGTATAVAERPAPAMRVALTYKLTDKASDKEIRGQGLEVMNALKAATEPVTVKQVADACVFAGSRQDKERVAGFYISQFKKKGLVEAVGPVEAAPSGE